jgi:hypothetical protein
VPVRCHSAPASSQKMPVQDGLKARRQHNHDLPANGFTTSVSAQLPTAAVGQCAGSTDTAHTKDPRTLIRFPAVPGQNPGPVTPCWDLVFISVRMAGALGSGVSDVCGGHRTAAVRPAKWCRYRNSALRDNLNSSTACHCFRQCHEVPRRNIFSVRITRLLPGRDGVGSTITSSAQADRGDEPKNRACFQLWRSSAQLGPGINHSESKNPLMEVRHRGILRVGC